MCKVMRNSYIYIYIYTYTEILVHVYVCETLRSYHVGIILMEHVHRNGVVGVAKLPAQDDGDQEAMHKTSQIAYGSRY